MLKTMHLGMDDTDSTRNGCTTYVATLLVEKLERMRVRFIDYPNLIRLNPNVPWKTRGNGALCLRFEYDEELETDIKKAAIDLVEELSDLSFKGTDPGIVFFQGHDVPANIKAFAKKTETSIVTLKAAITLVCKYEAEALGYNTRRGIIGALAAVGETLQGDHTYELIAYRTKENRGSGRQVDKESIFEMDRRTRPLTFNNVDMEKHRVIITPRSPDPILLGVRGETPQVVKQAFAMIKPAESVERWMVFRTNQGTDAHLTAASSLSQIRPYHSIIAKGVVSSKPKFVPVRHVIFGLQDSTAEVDCAAYEPTGDLRKVAIDLVEGDQVEVYGAVRRTPVAAHQTVNLEKIRIRVLSPKIVTRNPFCHSCDRSSESMGKKQGFRCRKCGARFSADKKVMIKEERHIEPGLYFTSTRSQRHLTKPLRRYGLEKSENEKVIMIRDWHS